MEAMRLFGVPRNTLRDFIGICELRIIDEEKYERLVQSVKEKTVKPSVLVIESKWREALRDYRTQAIRLKSKEKLLPFYPKMIFIFQNNFKKLLGLGHPFFKFTVFTLRSATFSLFFGAGHSL